MCPIKRPRKIIQLDLFKINKNGRIVPNTNIKAIRENKTRLAKEKQRQKLLKPRPLSRQQKTFMVRQTKIDAYNLAWNIIHSGKVMPDTAMYNDAWWIVKKMSPAKGVDKRGKHAKFKRIFEPTPIDLKGLEVGKLPTRLAQKFIFEAKEALIGKIQLD